MHKLSNVKENFAREKSDDVQRILNKINRWFIIRYYWSQGYFDGIQKKKRLLMKNYYSSEKLSFKMIERGLRYPHL